ncbi:hypothetical protein T10_659 [Trichinella papuae]|uniref:Uncharacterized protein n=1 Tax=Trichinella papuae TaxID=268474 RepID=A0A0V1M018_9BILA|nr:hypothetical protein T10_659 [Trichinella papuae]
MSLLCYELFLMCMRSIRILLFRSSFPFELRFVFALLIGLTCVHQLEEKRS